MSDHIYHWGLSEGEKKKNHKYVVRIEEGTKSNGLPNYRYFYSMDEYNAYKNGSTSLEGKNSGPVQKAQTATKNILNVIGSSIKSGAKTVSKIEKKIERTAKEIGSDTAKMMTKTSENVSSFLSKKANTVLNALPDNLVDTVKDLVDNVTEDYERANGKYDESKDGNHPSSFSELNKKSGASSSLRDCENVNRKNYDPSKSAYSQNCAYCSAAFDLRKRGYDVEASSIGPNTLGTNTEEEISSWYDGGNFSTVLDANSDPEEYIDYYYDDLSPNKNDDSTCEKYIDKLSSTLSDQGDGARGFLGVYWKQGGGHSITYEIQNGTVVYYDNQLGKKINIKDHLQSAYLTNLSYMRTDNLKPNKKILKAVKNR